MIGCTLDTSGLSSSGVRWRFQSASSLLQNLWCEAGGRWQEEKEEEEGEEGEA